MRTLFIIPARGGSKGLPGKNIKPLQGKPLLAYSLQYARMFAADNDICITTDDEATGAVAQAAGYQLPFYRPPALSNDTAGMFDVLRHALDVYETKQGAYDAIVLLQPTSPFRKFSFLQEALALYSQHPATDMVVSVTESKANPYFSLFEENENGYLQPSKSAAGIVRRQDAPPVFQYNGSLYIINTGSLRSYASLAAFPHIIKYVMPEYYSVDIDNAVDWQMAEYLLTHHLVEADGK
jgi:N-acylneuraminate cytidylyltransferase